MMRLEIDWTYKRDNGEIVAWTDKGTPYPDELMRKGAHVERLIKQSSDDAWRRLELDELASSLSLGSTRSQIVRADG